MYIMYIIFEFILIRKLVASEYSLVKKVERKNLPCFQGLGSFLDSHLEISFITKGRNYISSYYEQNRGSKIQSDRGIHVQGKVYVCMCSIGNCWDFEDLYPDSKCGLKPQKLMLFVRFCMMTLRGTLLLPCFNETPNFQKKKKNPTRQKMELPWCKPAEPNSEHQH